MNISVTQIEPHNRVSVFRKDGSSCSRRGFAALFIVILLGSVITGLAIWTATSGLWSIRASIDQRSSIRAGALANACMESALEMMREQNGYVGSGSLTIAGNSCQYAVANAGGDVRTISATASVDLVTRTILATTNAFN